MVVVAVAGGQGDFGRLLLQALVEAGLYEVYVLSRKVQRRDHNILNLNDN
jgi:nucleoside-diphosphate-sugar epimerase